MWQSALPTLCFPENLNHTLLAAAFALSILWMFGRAKVWQTLLRDRASYRDVLFTTAEGYLLNSFLPFRLGELGRAFLIARKSKVHFGEVLPTIVIERVVDLGISALIFLAALPLVVGAGDSERAGYIAGAVVIVGLVALYFLAHYNQWALDLFHKLSARWPSLQKFGGGFLESFFAGLGVLKDGWLFVRFLFWMTLNWGVALVAYYLMMLAYFPDAQFGWTFLILGAAAFGGAIPAAPGGLGAFDGAITWALTLLTGDGSTALAVALTARLYNYNTHGHKLRFPAFEKAQFVTECGISQQRRHRRHRPGARRRDAGSHLSRVAGIADARERGRVVTQYVIRTT